MLCKVLIVVFVLRAQVGRFAGNTSISAPTAPSKARHQGADDGSLACENEGRCYPASRFVGRVAADRFRLLLAAMYVFPAIRVVKGDGGQGIEHVERLEEGVREKSSFAGNIRVTIAVNHPQRVKSCLSH